MRRIFKYVGIYKVRMIIGLIIKIIGTLMDLAIPYILSYIIDDVIPTQELNQVIFYGIIMLICCAIGFSFNVIANRMASYVAKNVTTSLRHDLFEKIESLSNKQLDEVTMPSLISRMTTDTYNIHHMVGMMQRIGVRAPILLIGGIIVTFTMDPILTLVLLSTLPFVVILTIIVSKISLPLFTKVQEALDKLVRVIRENITGIRVIKALSKESFEKDRFEKVNKEVINYELKSGYTMASMSPIMNFILNMGLVGVIVFGAYRISSGETLIGKVISFTSYFTIILNAMLSITRIFVIYSRSNASAIRIDYIFKLPSELNFEERDDSSEYFIEFKDVNFEYIKKEELDESDVNRYNLNNINIQLKKGQSLGIIGPTGAGKTTIINLLLRLYDVSSGNIYVDGKNIKAYDKNILRSKVGIVLQNDTIFNDTIKNNIDFYRGLEEDDIIKAAKVSLAYNFIVENREEGFDFLLAPKGSNISGGQKQRLFLARALAANPEILVLDDSSSALDFKTDSIIRHNIKENYPNTTNIIISQRISSIMNCDYIMMIDSGIVTGYGSHDYLLKTNLEYRQIFDAQMGSSKGGAR
ncbi:MAG: ABC transporter ATP-binding protein [Bacilli bacterium]|nr:ABC transporter ATP-binding protein [Bacilli bacterium]